MNFQYYAESHAVIYIVDSSDRDRISDSKETFGKIYIQYTMINRLYTIISNLDYYIYFFTIFSDKMISSEHLKGVPLLVLANKQDIPDCMGVHTVKPIFNQNAHLIGSRDIMLMAVSALTG